MIRFGLVGVNTSHAGVFAGIFNGRDGGPPELEGGRVAAVWGGSTAETAALATAHRIPAIAAEPTRMLGAIDAVLVVDDTGGGASHADLARPFLEAGLPTFVDKPMTRDLAEAVALFDLAERHGAPLMSASALRFAAEVATLRDQAAGLGPLSSVVSVGPGDWFYYGVHAVEMAQTVIGTGARWVHRHAFAERDVAVIGYDGRPSLVVETLRDAAYVFHLAAYGRDGWAQAEVTDHRGFYRGTMAAVLAMAETGVAPVGRAETLEILAVLHAGERSAATGGPVAIADVLP